MNKKTVIFDLDGTLANIDTRRNMSLKPNGKLDWDIFADPSSILNWDVPNVPVIKMAVAGLKAQMDQAQGYEPDLIGGRSPRSDNNPFQTPAEITAAMSDPRYGKDAAYTQSVYARIGSSDVV